ncbi:MAG: carbohydrate binding domain-containing protein [Thermoguttaceae bacterium]|jgi:hypothetical protein|nr:carbohydrate binding domain-containing protein [Thermoguttaceae bacterium]
MERVKQSRGSVVSLRDVSADRELAAESASHRLFLLELSRPNDPEGKRIYVSSGEASLRLSNDRPDEMVQVSQNVHIGGGFQVGRTYRLSAWMKSEKLKQPNGIMLATFTDQMKATGSWRIPVPQTTGDWQRSEAAFTVPEGTRLLRIMLHVNGPGTDQTIALQPWEVRLVR